VADVAGTAERREEARNAPDPAFDWRRVAYLVHLSRAMDRLEEEELVPARKVLYQFSARGHDMAQVLLGTRLTQTTDAVCGYYRSRPLLLSLGVPLEDALGSNMGRAGGYSDGRDIGVVFNFPNAHGPSALPMSGGVGAQYTPTAGWAQAITYYRDVLKDPAYDRSIAVVLGGDASVATNGFWAALTIATTQQLPMLFYIEDNGYGISVPSSFQTPGGDIARNLASFGNLEIITGDGTEPAEAARLVAQAVAHVRGRKGPALIRLKVPRLQGHSYQDTQAYKAEDFVADEWSRDPLPKLRSYLKARCSTTASGSGSSSRPATPSTRPGGCRAAAGGEPASVMRHVFFEGELQQEGGQWRTATRRPPRMTSRARGPPHHHGRRHPPHARPGASANPRMLVFGEDIGPRAASTASRQACRRSTGGPRVRHQPQRGRALSAAPSAWPRPGCCRCPKSSSANMPSRRWSRSTIAARCAGAPPTASPRRWCCACRSAS
jgi:2-oxoisovalerate dehydrogenase E1 component